MCYLISRISRYKNNTFSKNTTWQIQENCFKTSKTDMGNTQTNLVVYTKRIVY